MEVKGEDKNCIIITDENSNDHRTFNSNGAGKISTFKAWLYKMEVKIEQILKNEMKDKVKP